MIYDFECGRSVGIRPHTPLLRLPIELSETNIVTCSTERGFEFGKNDLQSDVECGKSGVTFGNSNSYVRNVDLDVVGQLLK